MCKTREIGNDNGTYTADTLFFTLSSLTMASQGCLSSHTVSKLLARACGVVLAIAIVNTAVVALNSHSFLSYAHAPWSQYWLH